MGQYPCYEFDGVIPIVHPSSFVHPTAVLIGEVIISENVYIGPGAVLRGDWGAITIGKGSNIQENCIVHMFPGLDVVLEEESHIGHGAVIHGARVGRNSLIGMNAVLMDRVRIGSDSIVGALSFVSQDSAFPDRSLITGNPAQVRKTLDQQTIDWKSAGTKLYQRLPDAWRSHAKPAQPLSEPTPQQRTGIWKNESYFPKE